MSGFGRKEEIEAALSEMGRQMALHDASHLTVLCCGAAALCAVNVLSRSTLDVDAIGGVDSEDQVVPIEAFSKETAAAVAATAQKLGLTEDWFNLEASAILDRGLPEGAVARSARHARSEQRHSVGHVKVSHFLNDLGYSLQGNRKTEEGDDHPDRDAQFRHINRQVLQALKKGY